MMKKKTIALISGGISSEREVSLNSGNQVYDALDKNRYDILTVRSPDGYSTTGLRCRKNRLCADHPARALR
jgi:D-alanine-D-alanine ligase-like ATP-grasp enzyme